MKKTNALIAIGVFLLALVCFYSCRKDNSPDSDQEKIQDLQTRYNLKRTGLSSGNKTISYRNLEDLEQKLKAMEKTVSKVTVTTAMTSSALTEIEKQMLSRTSLLNIKSKITMFDRNARMSSSGSEAEIPGPTGPVTDPPGTIGCHSPNMNFNSSYIVDNFSDGTDIQWTLNFQTGGNGIMQNPSLQGFMHGYTPASSTISTPSITYTGAGKYYITVVTTQSETLTGSAGGFGTTVLSSWTMLYDTCNGTVTYSYINRLRL